MRNKLGRFIQGHKFNVGRYWNKEKKIRMVKFGFTMKGRHHSDESKKKMMTGKYLTCIVCGNIFYAKKSHLNKRKHCSKKCDAITRKDFSPTNKGKKFPEFSGKKAFNWKGGKTIERAGYIYIYSPDHPHAIHGRYVLEHRLIMEKAIGRFLKKEEIVHHKNMKKYDNRLSNLQIMSPSEHAKHHHPRLGKESKNKLP